jgi:hypothetical protein
MTLEALKRLSDDLPVKPKHIAVAFTIRAALQLLAMTCALNRQGTNGRSVIMIGADCAIAGVGHTTYGKLPEVDAYELGLWALKEALGDAGLGF